jgi:hypothetical protein
MAFIANGTRPKNTLCHDTGFGVVDELDSELSGIWLSLAGGMDWIKLT